MEKGDVNPEKNPEKDVENNTTHDEEQHQSTIPQKSTNDSNTDYSDTVSVDTLDQMAYV